MIKLLVLLLLLLQSQMILEPADVFSSEQITIHGKQSYVSAPVLRSSYEALTTFSPKPEASSSKTAFGHFYSVLSRLGLPSATAAQKSATPLLWKPVYVFLCSFLI